MVCDPWQFPQAPKKGEDLQVQIVREVCPSFEMQAKASSAGTVPSRVALLCLFRVTIRLERPLVVTLVCVCVCVWRR